MEIMYWAVRNKIRDANVTFKIWLSNALSYKSTRAIYEPQVSKISLKATPISKSNLYRQFSDFQYRGNWEYLCRGIYTLTRFQIFLMSRINKCFISKDSAKIYQMYQFLITYHKFLIYKPPLRIKNVPNFSFSSLNILITGEYINSHNLKKILGRF